MHYKLVVSDVDGCLSPEESAVWSLEPFVAVARTVQSRALPFTFCTGRPQPYVEALAKIVGVTLPVICENGAVIYDLASNRSRSGPGVTAEDIRALRAVRDFSERELIPAHAGVTVQYGKEAQLSLFSPEPDRIPALTQSLREFVATSFPEALRVDGSHFYINISISRVDKGTALAWLQRELDVRPEQTAVMGDTGGDLAMREHAALFAAPANATADVLSAADWVSEKSDVHALQEFLDRLTTPAGRPE